jgi:hypothetical protein
MPAPRASADTEEPILPLQKPFTCSRSTGVVPCTYLSVRNLRRETVIFTKSAIEGLAPVLIPRLFQVLHNGHLNAESEL